MVPVPVRCRLPDILSSLGKTQAWLSDNTGYSPQRISDYARMRRVMSLEAAYLISSTLKVEIKDLYVWKWQPE